MALKFIDEIDLEGKSVIARFDFNVPLNKKDPSKITDTTRIDSTLDTIEYILNNGSKKLILMGHLGRPKGQAKSEFSLEPVAKYLAKKLDQDVVLTESCTDSAIKTLLELPTTKIILLQNLRFHPEEVQNDREFAKILASYADIYVNDAFGTAHRKHASTYAINSFFKDRAVGGFLLKREIEALQKIIEKPKRPFMAICGGAKVSDKIKIIERLLISVDKLLIGGAMAYPFLKAKGIAIGRSLCSDEDILLAKKILSSKAKEKIILPIDHVIAAGIDGEAEVCDSSHIPDDKMGLDIGPHSLKHYEEILKGASTILWNGPMGIFENPNFANGTIGVAKVLAELPQSFTLIGGGDSVSAIKKIGLSHKMSHISTGGGASLEYIENGTLPGIQALKFGIS